MPIYRVNEDCIQRHHVGERNALGASSMQLSWSSSLLESNQWTGSSKQLQFTVAELSRRLIATSRDLATIWHVTGPRPWSTWLKSRLTIQGHPTSRSIVSLLGIVQPKKTAQDEVQYRVSQSRCRMFHVA